MRADSRFVWATLAWFVLWWRGVKQRRYAKALDRWERLLDADLRTEDPKAARSLGVWVSSDDLTHQSNGETVEQRLLRHEQEAARERQYRGCY